MPFFTKKIKRTKSIKKIALTGILLIGMASIITGCAGLNKTKLGTNYKVKKVPTVAHYTEWSDKMQKKADKMEGIRYYLPRPFVNVYESFPIKTDIYIAEGMVSDDGEHVLIQSITPEADFLEYTYTLPEEGIALKSQFIRARETQKESVPPVFVVPEAAGKKRSRARAQESSPQTRRQRGGREIIEEMAGSTNSNFTFAYQPLRGSNLDLVYLPDFDEQYAITSRAGLGNAKMAIRLGQGWSLQGINSIEDNEALNQRISDLIDSSIRQSVTLPDGLSASPKGVPGSGVTGVVPPAGEILSDALPGHKVSLKISVIHYAAKGLYPVIKPRELQKRRRATRSDTFFIDLFSKTFAGPYLATAWSEIELEEAAQAVDNEARNFIVPRYPYQYVSFQTFRYVAVEAISANHTQGPFRHLIDATGTSSRKVGRDTSAEKIIEDLYRANLLSPIRKSIAKQTINQQIVQPKEESSQSKSTQEPTQPAESDEEQPDQTKKGKPQVPAAGKTEPEKTTEEPAAEPEWKPAAEPAPQEESSETEG